MQPVLFLAWKEALELRRNPRLLPIILVVPIVQLLLFGYAAATDVRDVATFFADSDRSAASRELMHRFEASGYFRIVTVATSMEEAEPWLERGSVRLAVAIPAGYGAAIERARASGAHGSVRAGGVVQIIADGTDSNSTAVALGYAVALTNEYADELRVRRDRSIASMAVSAAEPLRGAGGPTIQSAAERSGALGPPRAEPLRGGRGPTIQTRVWFNPQLETRFYMLPGVLALLLMLVTANLSSMGIVREKEIGTLEQLNVSPLRRWELIAGKLLPYGIIGVFDAILVIAVAVLWFEVPVRGSLTLLAGMTMLYLVCTLGLGLFVSTISATQQQAMMTTVFFFLLPMVYLSGFVFPIENMPAAIQPVTYLIPLRYYLTIVRGIFLKGVGLDVLWPSAVAMMSWGTIVLGLAIARLQKRLA